ncbi:DUF2607 family protein [Paracidobacterium acidisoli]|uniref:DUF2607 family protein n=1 Tax=Paracidobacterium acidisoli TaxID=2303751 RepID=A0A372IRZ9_9BACT|nr:DUF2607 family protein [Paracidobacterium acidisoli]MBT9330597.1 DUF2607 family protein [Paracidobacterium acidisoli]
MRALSTVRRSQYSWAGWLGIFCILLVLMTGVIQVTHYHASGTSGQVDHDCSLCVTAHNVVQAVTLITLAVTSQPVAPLVSEASQPIPRQRLILKLANRPPPVISVSA